jgi:hypothetical protein
LRNAALTELQVTKGQIITGGAADALLRRVYAGTPSAAEAGIYLEAALNNTPAGAAFLNGPHGGKLKAFTEGLRDRLRKSRNAAEDAAKSIVETVNNISMPGSRIIQPFYDKRPQGLKVNTNRDSLPFRDENRAHNITKQEADVYKKYPLADFDKAQRISTLRPREGKVTKKTSKPRPKKKESLNLSSF